MTTDMHKAPSVARKALKSPGSATPVARYDLSTSEGGRRFIAEFFATELRRHDFTNYISTRLAADFACALAQHLAATGKHQAGEVHGDAHVVVLREMRARLTGAGSPARTAALDAAIAVLAARQPGAQEPEVEFQCRLMDVKTDLPTENWHHSPTYEENPGRGTHYWVQFRKRYIYYTPPAQGIDLGQQQDAARWRWVREQNGVTVSVEEADDDGDMTFVSGHTPEELDAAIDGQRDAAPGVGNG